MMPCLWVGKPVCHACAVGNHDLQGVAVIMVSLFYPYPYTESVCLKVCHTKNTARMLHLTCTGHRNSVYCKTDQLDALGVYLILGVQEGAFKEAFKFTFASISTKQIWFRRKHQESLLIIVDTQSINYWYIYMACLLKRSISAVSNLNFDVRILVRGRCVVIVSLSLLWIDIKQDAMRKPSIIKQETSHWMILLLFACPRILDNCHGGRLLERRCLLGRSD